MATDNMTKEEYIALFGEEAGTEMFKQQEAATSTGGSREPFPLLKKVTDSDLGIGKFGTFVFGTTFAKDRDDNGDKVVEEVGTNVGDSFSFVITNVSYRFKRWVEGVNGQPGKTEFSNIFSDLNAMDSAVDFNGTPLPSDKVARKEAGWKMVKILAGLIKTDKGWEPVIWEVDGKLYFTVSELLKDVTRQGYLSCVINFKTKTEKKSATKFTVVDVEKSTVEYDGIMDILKENRELVSDITIKMKEYQEANDYTNKSKAPSAPSQDASNVDNTNTNDSW